MFNVQQNVQVAYNFQTKDRNISSLKGKILLFYQKYFWGMGYSFLI